MTINDTDIDEIIRLISTERLNAITRYTKPKDSLTPSVIIKIHQDTLLLNGALMSIVASVEIALRNIVYQNLNQHFNAKNKLFQSPELFKWLGHDSDTIEKTITNVKRRKYRKILKSRTRTKQLELNVLGKRLPEKMLFQDKLAKLSDGIRVFDLDLIAQLTFSFWNGLYRPEYEKALWRPTLKNTFPNRKNMRGYAEKNLETIRRTRNRLAHHELVLFEGFDNTIKAIEFIAQNLNQKKPNPNSPLAKLLAPDIKKISTQADRLHRLISSPSP